MKFARTLGRAALTVAVVTAGALALLPGSAQAAPGPRHHDRGHHNHHGWDRGHHNHHHNWWWDRSRNRFVDLDLDINLFGNDGLF